jgi:hypothetical protein
VTDTRARILEVASAEIGPGRRADYWREVLGYDPGVKKAWCGAFCLWALHQVGLAREHKWGIDGSGMVGPLKLRQTRTPSRGDIAYLDQPFQHHFLFDYEYDGKIYSVDGNQPDVRQRVRPKAGIVFFSISPLLDSGDRDTDPLPPAHSTLREGSVSGEVRYLQSLLPGCKVDGQFGPKTKAFVIAFQGAAGLVPDGVVGPKTWAELEEGNQ